MSEVGEFAVIERAVAGRTQPGTTLLGPGDDAAIVRAADGRVVVSTDMLVQGRHFRFDWSSPHDVGRKAVAQNAADIVAMGARPTAFLVALGCPANTPASVVEGLSAGIGEAAEELNAGVVGGDLVQADEVVVSVNVLGDLEGSAAILRSGARVGDVVAVAGALGRSAAGLALLTAGVNRDDPDSGGLISAHRIPLPPYDCARAATHGSTARPTSMTDVSDGLLADLGHICESSRIGMDLSRRLLPVGEDLVAAADRLGVDPEVWVLTGGEDHAFAGTFPADTVLPPGWIRVGRVREGADISLDGESVTGAVGWQSFSV